MRTLPIFLAFFLMGLADAMGPMSDAVKSQYQLSNVMSTLLSFFVFIAFAVFSVPGGLLAARIGKKKLLLLGLGLNAVACLVPSIQAPSFGLLLGCIFLLGVGTTFLQVAGNPIMRDVSAEGRYSRNLAFAQGIKGLGSTACTHVVIVIGTIALFQSMGWRGTFPLFFVLMTIAFLGVILVRVKETKADVPPSIGSSVGLLKEPIFFLAVLGIFLYVGAEASMGRFLLPTLQAIGVNEKAAGFGPILSVLDHVLSVLFPGSSPASRLGPVLFFAMLTIGRLLGSAVLTIMTPRTCFRLSALLGGLGAAALMTGSPSLAIPGVVAAGLGFANIWPMLFSITVEEKPECANELSGLMCMAISGGAIVPLVMGQLRDMDLKALAFVVPTGCFVYLFLLSLKGGRQPAAPALQEKVAATGKA
jgi:MFS transporter, FHS family, L-fucose permease